MVRLLVVALGMLLAVPASADDLADSLASIRRAMAGHWSGAVSGADVSSGETFEEDDAFTFAVTSEDGLDSALWSAASVELADYESDGRYRIRNWNIAGRHRKLRLGVRIAEEPDSAGNGAFVYEGEWASPDGALMEAREEFSLDGDTLRMTVEMRPAGSNEPFETTVTGMWTREPAD